MLATSRQHSWMHLNPVITLMLTINLYTKNLFRKPILKLQVNTVGLTTDAPVGNIKGNWYHS